MRRSGVMAKQQFFVLCKGGLATGMGMGMNCARPMPGVSMHTLSRSVCRGRGGVGCGLKGRNGGAVFSDISRRERGIVRYSTESRREKESKQPTPPPTPLKKPLEVLKSMKSLTPHENIYTVPNILTFSRLIAAPVCGYLVLHDQHAWAVGLFAYAGITDLVDGWIARKWNLQTVVGTVIDPMADKTLMTILTVCLAIKGGLPVWLATIILGRDIGLAISAIYWRWISLPPPKTFSRYWDFSLPSAEVHPTTISKYNTALQLGLIGATTALPLITWDVGIAMTGFQYLVATTTIWSGMSYIYTKDAVKIVGQPDPTKKEKEKEQSEKKQ
ncbi:Bccrd1 [Botrytis cinerea B05.10]|uniref:Bccrd1 n=3 Tax=Botryotinia fuckeliana TaxID=40559 RepID=A0A384JD80_BOTFB|nr:Bccrd1 [Botrytis cinerea B05.10]ATZ48546.1 Bccrd1 [Botrytis cinerea B05.10]EMR82368.1 putative cdp-alcohol phosphatidyltransferase protein [Botrytis cinerea BcDW1]CCD51256.2 similar to cardiolipin synthase [Botrytis cinerea T4]